MPKIYYVYILASQRRVLYVGVTSAIDAARNAAAVPLRTAEACVRALELAAALAH